ncbi:maleylpyruvate isomerase family mycothiol-dependent enzyme [Kineococcus aurantiacus]|uniref:Uncharacterized protein (TIGR03083 family) n=1 Tax=Kineococcus aurantiacus TaxID=37633 RepID=A0A7Y9DNW5_9ACTN|nr:uncharacterized protein (TIGR03083 family) [Kineococcus aurantiacus]
MTTGSPHPAPPALDVRTALEAQQRAFLALAREVGPDAAVPGCPGWRALDLVTHLTGVHRWAAAVTRTPVGGTVPDDADPAPDPAPCAAYAAAARDLLTALGEDPARPCPTFAGHGVVADWGRRQLHETLVHTWDLADAAGRPREGAPDVVADAVEEVLDTVLPRQVRLGRVAAPAVAVELLGSRRRVLGTGPVVASVSGADADLVRLLWRRTTCGDPRLVVRGDARRAREVLGDALTP